MPARKIADRSVTLSIGLTLMLGAVTGCGGDGGVRKMRAEQPIERPDAAVCPTAYECEVANVKAYDCAAPAHLTADGHVTNFSCQEWSGSAGKWCSGDNGNHGSLYHFPGRTIGDSAAHRVDTDDGSFRLALTVSAGSYGGGGIQFEGGCFDVSAFTGVEFSVAVASGRLTGCTYQVQVQTFEQRPTMPFPGGSCDMNTSSCYGYPSAANLPAPSTDPTMPTVVSVPFAAFSASVMPTPKQVIGLQWQVNSSAGACTVELRIDDIRFIPAVSPADAGTSDDAATTSDAASSS